jgi:hypothetical protein
MEVPYPSLPGALLALEEQAVSGPVVLVGLGDAAARAALGNDAALAGIVLAQVGLGSGAPVFRTGGMSGLGQLAAPFCEALAWGGSAMPTPLPVLASALGPMRSNGTAAASCRRAARPAQPSVLRPGGWSAWPRMGRASGTEAERSAASCK